MPSAYDILTRKRGGESLSEEEIRSMVKGAADGGWSDAQLGAFLMAAVLQGLDAEETRSLTVAMLESGAQWRLRDEIPTVGDKHSTGGVGDKVSLILSPLLAACDQPVVMLTGRGLGHTAGTADKLDTVPGLDQALDRERSLDLLRRVGVAVGMATDQVAPADRRLYGLRDVTATVDSIPLITGSILSKKLASGAGGVVFDIKTGDGAFLPDAAEGRRLGELLVETARALGTPSSALITDMSQPLGQWVGHASEVRESLDCLEGSGPEDLMEVTYALCEEVGRLLGRALERATLEEAITSGRARERFDVWAEAQGADPAWLAAPELPLAPEEVVLEAPRSGILGAVANRRIGLLMSEAGAGRARPGEAIDHGVSLKVSRRIGDAVEAGDELARLYLRRRNEAAEKAFRDCFHIGDEAAEAPELVRERIG